MPTSRLWICIASGWSLSRRDLGIAHDLVTANQARVIVANSTAFSAPWADHVMGDPPWWSVYHREIFKHLPDAAKWTTDRLTADRCGIFYVSLRDDLVPDDGFWVGDGGNTGHRAVHLAYALGARRIALLGYDMARAPDGRFHHHPDHPAPLKNCGNHNSQAHFAAWRRRFAVLVSALAERDVEIYNCSWRSPLRGVCRERLNNVAAL